MLHIILFILKIIGFLILGILALLLLLTAVFLLAPFVYRAEFSADNSPESIRGSIRFHWLMHLISGHVSYEDGTFTWHIRAAWKKFGSEEDVRAESPPERREKSERPEHSEHSRMFGQRAPRNDGKSQSVRNIQNIPDSRRKNSLLPPSARKPPPAQAEKSGK